ncbi:lipoate--protein ligase family protein [Aciduricibacillus chroicocephali]|uniref:Octanoyl-[GcvH]:protein N-octanoyltransferase n=1 Tax=Aciduricibacillus chroicocephali TaxID=3054939 RepID=A0ABY9KTT0_9BACI|nr:lipoate--protein ligase family protein [Bacillaceae bacterium 44XB]
MENWQETFEKTAFRIFDQSKTETFAGERMTAEMSFAIDDALALSVSETTLPAMRLWVHNPSIVLGIPDSRLPHLPEALDYAAVQGHDVIIRNSGGLAVVLDHDVLNISLILPGSKHLGIHEGYDLMVAFVRYMLRDLTDKIEAYEIVGSYCPGDYDLSIGGRKFAGISQRRVKDGVAVQIYLDAAGDSRKRAELVKDFYNIGLGGETVKNPPPDIRPETMASLSELLGISISANDLGRRAILSLDSLSAGCSFSDFTVKELADFQTRLQQMKKRNEPIRCHKSDN